VPLQLRSLGLRDKPALVLPALPKRLLWTTAVFNASRVEEPINQCRRLLIPYPIGHCSRSWTPSSKRQSLSCVIIIEYSATSILCRSGAYTHHSSSKYLPTIFILTRLHFAGILVADMEGEKLGFDDSSVPQATETGQVHQTSQATFAQGIPGTIPFYHPSSCSHALFHSFTPGSYRLRILSCAQNLPSLNYTY